MKKISKGVLAVALCTALVTTLLPQANYVKKAKAEEVGAFSVTGGAKGTDYTYENNVLTILSDAAIPGLQHLKLQTIARGMSPSPLQMVRKIV